MLFIPPPSANGRNRRQHAHAQPGREDGDGVAGLLGGIEQVFDAFVIARATPGAQQSTDRVDLKDLLKRQRDLRSHDRRQRQVQHRIARHKRLRFCEIVRLASLHAGGEMCPIGRPDTRSDNAGQLTGEIGNFNVPRREIRKVFESVFRSCAKVARP